MMNTTQVCGTVTPRYDGGGGGGGESQRGATGFAPRRSSASMTQEQLQGYFNTRRSAAPSFGTASRFTNSQPNRHISGNHTSPPNSRTPTSGGSHRGGAGRANQFTGVDPSHIDPYGCFSITSKPTTGDPLGGGGNTTATRGSSKKKGSGGAYPLDYHRPGPGYYTPGGNMNKSSTGVSFGRASRQLASSGQPHATRWVGDAKQPTLNQAVVGPGRYAIEEALIRPRVVGGSWGRASKTRAAPTVSTTRSAILGGSGNINDGTNNARYQDAVLTTSCLRHNEPGPGNYNVGAATLVESRYYNDRQGGAIARAGRESLHHKETASARSIPGPGYYTPLYGA